MPQYLVALDHPNRQRPSVEAEAPAMGKASERRRKDNSRWRTPMKTMERTIWIFAPVLAISIALLAQNAAAQPDPHPNMPPVTQYFLCAPGW